MLFNQWIVFHQGVEAFCCDQPIGESLVERLCTLMQNSPQQAVIQFFGHLFFLFDPGDVFEIKFQVTFHVCVECGWRDCPARFHPCSFSVASRIDGFLGMEMVGLS